MRRPAISVALAGVAVWAAFGGAFGGAAPAPFFPMAVWYSGGTARAPMLSPIDTGSERAWRADLQAIKTLGFNAVRTWVEWSAGEPREGAFQFDNLDLMLRLAEEAGLKSATFAIHAPYA
ncbi:MAG: beta-galactosidase, partial [Acidobacteria bacterium]|nr:beta-galactosidase [Acidobacteriota bacterium]